MDDWSELSPQRLKEYKPQGYQEKNVSQLGDLGVLAVYMNL
jgi:hypothetical protein